MRLETRVVDVVGGRSGPRQRRRACRERLERDEVEDAAIEARPGAVALVAVVTVVADVHVRVRSTGGTTVRGCVIAVTAIARTMSNASRPGELEGQHGQQKEEGKTFHGGGV